MATIPEIFGWVQDECSRPDMDDLLNRSINPALRSAHSTEKFKRDLAEVSVKDPAIFDGVSQIGISLNFPRLREIRKIDLYTAYTEVGSVVVPTESTKILNTEFKDLMDTDSGRDYYGLEFGQTYSIFGDVLNLKGVDTSTTAVKVSGLYWPTLTTNVLSGDLETNSWICIEYPILIQAYLVLAHARATKDKDRINAAITSIQQYKAEFLHSFASELLK